MRTLILSLFLLSSFNTFAVDDDEADFGPLSSVLGEKEANEVQEKAGANGGIKGCAGPVDPSCVVIRKNTDTDLEFEIEGATFPSGVTDLAVIKKKCPQLQSKITNLMKGFISNKTVKSFEVHIKGFRSHVPSSVNHGAERAKTGKLLMEEILKGVPGALPTYSPLLDGFAGPEWTDKMNKDDCEFTKAQRLSIGITVARGCSFEAHAPGGAVVANGPHSSSGTGFPQPFCNTQVGAGGFYSVSPEQAAAGAGMLPSHVFNIGAPAKIEFKPRDVPDRMIVSKNLGGDKYQVIYDSCFVSDLYSKAAETAFKKIIEDFGKEDFSATVEKLTKGKYSEISPVYSWVKAAEGPSYHSQLKTIMDGKYPSELRISYEIKRPFKYKFTSLEASKEIGRNPELYKKEVIEYCKQYLTPKLSTTEVDKKFEANGEVPQFFRKFCVYGLSKTYPPYLIASALASHFGDSFKSRVLKEEVKEVDGQKIDEKFSTSSEGMIYRLFGKHLINRNMLPIENGTLTTKEPLVPGPDGKLYVYIYGTSVITKYDIKASCQQ